MPWTNKQYPINNRSVPYDEPCEICKLPAGEHYTARNGRRDEKAVYPRCLSEYQAR